MHVKVSNENGVATVEVVRPGDGEVVDTLEVSDGQTATLTATVNDGAPGVDVGQVAPIGEDPAPAEAGNGTDGTAGGEVESGESAEEAGSEAPEGEEPPAEAASA